MDSQYPGQKALTGEGAANRGSMYTCTPRCSANPSSPATSGILPAPRFSRPVVHAIRNAEQIEGGVEIVLHANIVTGKELKRTLDAMFPGPQEYSVQLRRDRYRVTLPKRNKADIEHYVPR